MADPKSTVVKGGLNAARRLFMTDAEKAAQKSVPGVHYADPLKPASMRMSEALGNAGAEGKTLNFTEADRSRVFGSNRGGVGFSGLQHYSEPHKEANTVWGFGNKTTAEKKTRQNDPEKNLWTTFVGAPTQHKSNTVVLQDAVKEFQDAVKAGKVHPAQIKLMNERIKLAKDDKTGARLFDDAYDLTDPGALGVANSFARRSAIGDVLLGEGVKGPMRRKAFKEENKGQTWHDSGKMERILKRETDPDLVDAETFDVGNRLFIMDNGIIHRPDLNVAFPYQVTGEDLGMKFQLTPKEIAMRDWMKQYEKPRGKTKQARPPDYMDLSRNNPSQFVDEDYLTFLQKEGHKDGGAIDIKASDARLAKAMEARMSGGGLSGGGMAKGGKVDIKAADARLNAAMAQRMAGGGKAEAVKGVAKGFKRLFGENVLPAAEREANLQKFLEPSKAPMRLYHGTTASEGGKGQEAIRRIKPSKEGALGSGVYLTPNPNYAEQYTYKGAGNYGGGNTLPVHAQIKNPLVIDGSASNDPMIEALMKLGMDEAQASRMVERAYDQKGYIGKEVETRARAQGYDGLMQYDKDGELGEVVSYQPGAVKSAIGNEGTYDTMQLDLNKAHGGIAHMAPGGLLKGAGKLGKRLFGGADELTPATKGGTRKFGEDMGGLSIVKEPNGNWITGAGSPEAGLKPLRRSAAEEQAYMDFVREQNKAGGDYGDWVTNKVKQDPAFQKISGLKAANKYLAEKGKKPLQVEPKEAALNAWVDRNLTNYVKKQMGTADDPVRRLAEEGVIHIPSNEVGVNRYKAKDVRAGLGMPQLGKSEAAKAWEDSTDYLINVAPASKHTKPLSESEIRQGYRSTVEENPWLENVAPDTPIYAAKSDIGSDLGFDHIMDVLREDVTAGRIRPEQLNKVSMEQAVRRTFEYDQELAAKMNAARAAQREGLPVYKEYPEGYRWVELNKPGAFASESEAMGHSVRGYEPPAGHADWVEGSGEQGSLGYGHGGWEGIKRGDAKVYSLVDSKGQPHATVEIKSRGVEEAIRNLPDAERQGLAESIKDQYFGGAMPIGKDEDRYWSLIDQAYIDRYGAPSPSITQIKGKSNRAPNEEYLPFVQDFVQSGQWSEVGDLRNTRLRDVQKTPKLAEYLKNKGVDAPRYLPETDYLKYEDDFLMDGLYPKDTPPAEGMAEGGGAFKTLQWSQPKGFDGGGIASPEESNTYSPEPFVSGKRWSDIKKNAAEMFDETKQSLANDYDRLKNSGRARAQLAKIAAAQIAGGAPDLAHLGVDLIVDPLKSVTVDKLLTKPAYRSVLAGPLKPGEKQERVPMFGSISDALKTEDGLPIGGSEHMIKRAQEAGLMGQNRFSPLTEISGAILGGVGLSKLGKVANKGYQKNIEPRVDPAGALSRAITDDSNSLLPSFAKNPLFAPQSVKLTGVQPEAKTASTGKPKGATYATKQEGPFYRVSPTFLDVSGAKNRGIREATELQGEGLDLGATGQAGREVPQLLSPEEVGRIIADPVANQPLQIAQRFTKETQVNDFVKPDIPESSLAKQSAIGRAQQLAVEGSPEYKSAVFDAYAKQMPDLLEQVGAKNYDDLMEKAYRQMAKETDEQFKRLPYNFSYHRAGEGNYNGAMDMASDVHGNKHLYVYQGGDPHDFLNRLDKASGLNENEKFRAVHDLLGHAIYGNQFGPKGEEMAWAVHQQMYSPLARLAMTAETRGQNSMVNYSPLNVKVKSEIAGLDELEVQALRKGDKALVDEIRAAKRQAYSNFEFAPNKAVLLPPEFVDPKFTGGLPDYLSAANRPAKGTETQSVLTHFSHNPNLQFLDPTRYGTGIKGAEAERLREYAGGVKDRSYVYLGEPGTIAPESGLGVNRYRGESSNLYDITKDPLSFRALARESNRTPFTAKVNAGITSPLQEANDYERLVKEYGYEGMINPNASKPMGIMFKPTPVQPRKRGGLTQLRAR